MSRCIVSSSSLTCWGERKKSARASLWYEEQLATVAPSTAMVTFEITISNGINSKRRRPNASVSYRPEYACTLSAEKLVHDRQTVRRDSERIREREYLWCRCNVLGRLTPLFHDSFYNFARRRYISDLKLYSTNLDLFVYFLTLKVPSNLIYFSKCLYRSYKNVSVETLIDLQTGLLNQIL